MEWSEVDTGLWLWLLVPCRIPHVPGARVTSSQLFWAGCGAQAILPCLLRSASCHSAARVHAALEPRAIIYVGSQTPLEIVFKSFNNICYGRSSRHSSIFHLRLYIVRALWCAHIGPALLTAEWQVYDFTNQEVRLFQRELVNFDISRWLRVLRCTVAYPGQYTSHYHSLLPPFTSSVSLLLFLTYIFLS